MAVVPQIHEMQDMSPEKIHSSFDAPGLIRKHNQDHKAQFEAAYHFPKELKSVTKEPTKYHMIFSTSCSPFQNWQALAFFYFAHKVRQPGTVTRLVSGCTDEQAEALNKVHEERVVPLAIPGLQTFEMHVTPDFDDSNGGDQKYFNKPNGLLHWMEQTLGFDGKSDHEDDDSIIIIVDPDMMLIRPITDDVSTKNYVGGWVNSKNTRMHKLVDYEHDIVTHGKPHAQQYGYGDNWFMAVQDHLEEIVGPDSPALKVSHEDGHDFYPAGPPYIATAKDMYQIAVHWVKFLPKYHKYFDGMMCEMHSYSLAAAHLQLPHKLAKGFMVSDVDASENFDFIEKKMNKSNVCMDPPKLVEVHGKHFDARDSTTMTDPAYEKEKGISIRELPFVLHYCQRYALGRYFFSKYKLREDMFDDCEGSIMLEPPRNVAEVYDWSMFPNGVEHYDFSPDPKATSEHKEAFKPFARLRNGWMLCAVVYGVNEAIQAYKRESCGTDEKYFQKTWHFHEEALFKKSIEDPSNPFTSKEE
eukprot:CAMPEP_0116118764 /NCGR_PEP_ID=MMETSP0329-20121206/2281_1 /TAXON_ID=697910 /ORGANISM="Pseudo-nitzschia arenysensis, Strain B593" /LENGTH=524 /DNA_ID=CAMNT_0003612419 /DNA_START=192 /DNA_END=1766 /DNA_ORIENTATION=-